MDDSKDILLDHDYDGIQELDNNLPNWWIWLFWLTIVWSFLYMGYYHVSKVGYLSDEEYTLEMNPDYMRLGSGGDTYFGILPEYRSPLYSPARDLAAERKRKDGRPKRVFLTRETDTTTYFALTDESNLASGREIYVKNCASCHGMEAQGDIGPNLTDNYWIHGDGINNSVKSIKYGYPLKGMIAWRGFISDEQIIDVASYVMTVKGTNPANPKAPQGDLIE